MLEKNHNKLKVSVLVPCYNEEKTIGKCISSILNQTIKPQEVIVVNDGSTDNSKKIISSFKDIKLIDLEKNTGNKSKAIEKGLKHVTGDIIVFTDADSFLKKDFIEKSLPHFNDKTVGAVAGKVISIKKNWLTACRELEYIIAQEIHKKGQAILGAVMVVPGCSAVFRKNVLSKIIMDHDTITEDMDITFKIHKLGYKVNFEPSTGVYTNDPSDIRSYIKQLQRWYLGSFQNLRKHKDIIGKKKWLGKVEIPITVIEGLVFGIFYLLSPLLFILMPSAVIFTFVIDFAITSGAALYGIVSLKRYDLVKVVPVMFFVRVFNVIVWLYSFLIEIILRKNIMIWYRVKR
ncbi:MAG: glycosyltransferase [Candidatus Heimdallarchaeaceae archaeon]